MNIPVQLIVFSIPAWITLFVRKRRGEKYQDVMRDIGWQGCALRYYLLGLLLLVILGLLGWMAMRFVPVSVLHQPGLSFFAYAGSQVTLITFLGILLHEAIYVALGEEIFFRGWLGGWLFRKFGFALGNVIQAVFFLLPHLLLLSVSTALYPILLVQLLAGWLLGWLRYQSGSILPGWVVHSLTNALSVMLMMAR